MNLVSNLVIMSRKLETVFTIDLSKSSSSETRYSGDTLTTLQLLTLDEVKHLIESSHTKSCELDPIPTWLVKECMLELLPLITAIINNSITSSVYPCLYRKAIVRPLLKKTGLDPNEYKNYRPVSNLFFISKLIENALVAIDLSAAFDLVNHSILL